MNNKIDRYLRKATRGLWGNKRREVKEELTTHIEGRIATRRMAGMLEADAIEKTLQELGHPREVNTEMTKLHTMPSLIGLGAALAVTVVLTVTLISGGMAQPVLGTFYWPSQTCISAVQDGTLSSNPLQDFIDKRQVDSCFPADNSLWLNMDTLRPIFESVGIQVRSGTNAITLIFPNSPDDELVSFPIGSPNVSVMGDDNKPIPVEPGYFDLWELVKAVALKSKIPMSIESWDNPTIHIGDASFQIGTTEQPFQGTAFYENYLENVVSTVTVPIGGDYVDWVNPHLERLASAQGLAGADWDESHVTQTSARLDTKPTSGIYGVIGVLDLDNPLTHNNANYNEDMPKNDAAFYMALARANPDGTVDLELPANETVRFVDSLSAQSEPGETMLVELTASAGSWFKVVSPDQIRLE